MTRTIEELKEQGYKFYKEFKGKDYTNSDKNRSRNIKTHIEGKYEYQVQKQKKSKGTIIQEAGIWIKDSGNIFVDVCKTTKSLRNFETLLDFYLTNHIDYLTVDEIVKLSGVSERTVVSFEKYCREIGLMEKQSKPEYQKSYNKFTGKEEEREVPTMEQYYYVSVNGQKGKLATTKEYYKTSWQWIYKRAGKLTEEFLKKNPKFNFVTEEVYNGFKKQAQAEFNKLFGHKVRRGNTRKINVEKLLELGIDKKPNREPLPKEKIYKIEVIDFNTIDNDIYNIMNGKNESDFTYEEYMELVEEHNYYSEMYSFLVA